MTKGLYEIDDSIYNNAVTKYVENNRCVLGFNLTYDVVVEGTTYHQIKGIDIIPGDHIDLSKGNPIRIKMDKMPNKISITKTNKTITIETII